MCVYSVYIYIYIYAAKNMLHVCVLYIVYTYNLAYMVS